MSLTSAFLFPCVYIPCVVVDGTDIELFSAHLSRHNVLEHDASLSRVDAYFGDASLFSPAIFSQTTKYWNKEILTVEMLANSKLARMIESRAFNPTYTFTSVNEEFSLGEVAAPILVFGDTEAMTVERKVVASFFGECLMRKGVKGGCARLM